MNDKTSKIILCSNIKLDKDYKNVLSYTEVEMLALCNDNKVVESNNFSFIKPNKNEIEVPFTYQQCLVCNYMAFQNPNYSNKWFFAFIDSIEYRSDGATRITFTVDIFSTWWEYWTPKACYVLREHVNDDTIGANTVPENLERGEYTINYSDIISNKLRRDAAAICIGVSKVPSNTLFQTYSRQYGSLFSGLTLIGFDQFSSAAKFVSAYDDLGMGGDIVTIYMIPYDFIRDIPTDRWQIASVGTITDIRFVLLPSSTTPRMLENNLNIPINTTIDNYTPRNNKLYTFPYNYLSITNNVGTEIDYHYEDFINNSPVFDLYGIETVNCPIMLTPQNYKKYTSTVNIQDIFYNYGIPAGKYPTCSWKTDNYTNWLTQNGMNILGHKINAPTSLALKGLLGASRSENATRGSIMGGAITSIASAVQETYQHSLQSNTLNGQIGVADLSFAGDQLCYTYYKMSVKEEYARIIDDFWYRYGYQINRIKLPNQTGRLNFNYVQIGEGENIGYSTSGVNSSDMEEINNIYRRGVTIWHNHANLGDFSVANTITN